jgi:hypothetical protein
MGKAPAASQKRASQVSGGQRTKRQKTKPNETPAGPLTYHEVESNSDPEPLPMHRVMWIRKLVKAVSKKGRAMRAMRTMKTMKARRKMRVMRKMPSNISLSTIDCNPTPCQALQYTRYHLVKPVEPVPEPVRSSKWAIGWLQSSNL